jgi:hypothetical protein
MVLKKKVDWRTIKQAKNIIMPKEQDIPRRMLRFPNGGLILSRGQIRKEEEENNTKKFEEDNDFDGTCLIKVNTVLMPKKALKALCN